MGSVKYGSIVVDVRGKIAGTVYGRNSTGSIARSYVMPQHHSSGSQINTRKTISSLTSKWSYLTSEERLSWISAAAIRPFINRLSQSQYYTGQQLFMKHNTLLAMYALGPIITLCPPQSSIRRYVWNFATVIGNPNGSITLVRANLDLTPVLTVATVPYGLLFATRSMSVGVSRPRDSDFRFINKILDPDLANTATAAYRAIYGYLTEGKAVFLKYIIVDPNTGNSYEMPLIRSIVL